jgi:dihydroorotase
MADGSSMTSVVVLKNAHVIDPAQGIDGVATVTVVDGKIASVGDGPIAANAEVIDLAGQYLSPGWIDIHVHAYGSLGFGDADTIGIKQGVTSFIDAGGAGVGTLDEFSALTKDLITDAYTGPHIMPIGIIGQDHTELEDDHSIMREIETAPLQAWMKANPGVMRFLKVGAYAHKGLPPIDVARRIATELGVPLYMHIGENHVFAELQDPFEYAIGQMQAGDIVTHVYNGCPQGRVLDKQGNLRACVKEAAARGVLFDIGMGSYGFAWDVAEKTLAQGLRPNFISSDLQQFNVLNPTYSLANVMTMCLRLGLPLKEVIDDVTASPARHLALTDRAGSLRPGMPADITIFSLEKGSFEILDCVNQKRTVDTKFVPIMAFKNGRRVDCDVAMAQDERNWFMSIVEDRVPEATKHLSAQQIEFLTALSTALSTVDWIVYSPQNVDIRTAMKLQNVFHQVSRATGVPLKDALHALYDCFLEVPFPIQVGLFLLRLERPFALQRLSTVVAGPAKVAA